MQWAEVFRYLLLMTGNRCHLLDKESGSTLGCGTNCLELFLSFLTSKTAVFNEVPSSYITIPFSIRMKEYYAQDQKSVRVFVNLEARWNANSICAFKFYTLESFIKENRFYSRSVSQPWPDNSLLGWMSYVL